MSVPVWTRITPADAIPPREGRVVVAGDREIALFNLGDRFLAVSNRCPHKGGPLADGIVSGQSIVCPLHGWKVHLEGGHVERPAGTAACVHRYPVRVENGIVSIALAGERDERDGEAA
jgi:nitrite reductase (NADH) small subunit